MPSHETYRKRPFTMADLGPWAIVGLAVLAGLAYLGWQLGNLLNGQGWRQGMPKDWTGLQQVLAIGLPGLLLLAGLVLWIVHLGRPAGADVHRKAKHLGRGQEMTYKAAQKRVEDGKLVNDARLVAGLFLCRAVQSGQDLFTSWRDSVVAIMGPGAGKTTGQAIPYCLEAPGLLVATSNKRDLADAIRGAREKVGTFWCFDPQRIADYHAGSPAPWWWNPMTYTTDETRALSLAKLFANAESDADTKKDPFFDKEGPLLLARLMLAASVGGYHFPQVFRWLNKPKDRTAIQVLEKHGLELSAAALQDCYNWNPDQRQGVFATAKAAVEFLDNRDALQWIAPLGPDDDRPEFHPVQFVKGRRDTILSMSKEGDGSLGPITAALTKALLDAAEDHANKVGGGRMPVPIVFVLDEAANTCKIPDLPRKYSFYGGLGMFLVTILQNPAQGENAWGPTGMRQLWAAATHRVVGAGCEDMEWINKVVVPRVGKIDIQRWTQSNSEGRNPSRSVSSSITSEDILAASDVAEMPFGTVLVLPSGGAAVMAKTVPWWERSEEMNASVGRSLEMYKPRVVDVSWN